MTAATILTPHRINGTPARWSERYGERHKQVRITDFPTGITAPKKVRIYHRREHYILQWWDRRERRTLSDRVDGDLVAAIARAREIEAKLESFRTAGAVSRRKLSHPDLVARFLADLRSRADAGEIDPRTADRYASALAHYLAFAASAKVAAAYPSAGHVDREFALLFAAYLAELRITPNGHVNATRRRMASPKYVEGVVRSLFAWAADPDRGNLLPPGFRSPFSGSARRTTEVARDPFGEPDVTIEMAAELLVACDAVQLSLFAMLALYGLRASEPCFLFREDLDIEGGWLKVPCRPELAYVTKGRREKRLPLVSPVAGLLAPAATTPQSGLLFLRRAVLEGREQPSLLGATADELEAEFERRCRKAGRSSAKDRIQVRDAVLRDAGGLSYDQVAGEFALLARQLGWPAAATLKDLRHLAATSFENAGMPLFSRRYLLGQSPGRGAIVSYTHINELRRHYEEAAAEELADLRDAAARRGRELALLGNRAATKRGCRAAPRALESSASAI